MKRRTLLMGLGIVALLPTATAQPVGKVYRLGLLGVLPFPPLTDPFVEALDQRGWKVGHNIQIESRFTARDHLSAPKLARELVDQSVDVIVTITTANALAARQASSSIPIVMLASGYPVESGLAASLARPGGNVTGLSIYASGEVFGKHVQLLRELVPSLRELGVFWGYSPPAYSQKETDLVTREMRRAADALKMGLRVWMTGTIPEFNGAIAAAEHSAIEALFVSAGGVHGQPDVLARITEFTMRRRLPTMSDAAGSFFQAAGVLTYTANFKELGARAASFVDRILRGARPSDLPIELPTKFELLINLKTARALGITVPRMLLLRADRVIE